MIVHAPIVFNQRGAVCKICQGKKCVFSPYIQPCLCEGYTVHEQCLEDKIISENSDFQTMPLNQRGFHTYSCQKCHGQIYFKNDFSREKIYCSQFSGCEICLILQLFTSLIVITGILVYLIRNYYRESALIIAGVALGLFTLLLIPHLYLRLTAKFWKSTERPPF